MNSTVIGTATAALGILVLSLVQNGCRDSSVAGDQITLHVDEAANLVVVGSEFKDWLDEQESNAAAFKKTEGLTTDRHEPTTGLGHDGYRVEVARVGNALSVQFIPRNEPGSGLRDGTIEYLVQHGQVPHQVHR